MGNISDNINDVVQSLNNKGVILTPTDTVWGLSADARSKEAYDKLVKLKGRSAEKGIIVLVHTEVWLERCVQNVPDIAWDLLEIQTKPTTIVFQNATSIISHVTPPDNSIGMRMIHDGPMYELLRKFNAPLLSSSANFSGQSTPARLEEIDEDLIRQVDFVFQPNGYVERDAQPSSVIKLNDDGGIKILRS